MKNDPDTAAVEPHAAQLTVWDVPSAAVAGERINFYVGARCSAGCSLAGRVLNVFDHEGSLAGTAKLGDDVWPGTEALYFAAVEANAPREAGSRLWQAKLDGCGAEVPQEPCACPLTVRVVAAPDCEVTVRVLDTATQSPIEGARVVMHPYRAVTDANGIAKIKAAKGQYDILVSASQHMASCASVELAADLTTTAELEADLPWSPPDEDFA